MNLVYDTLSSQLHHRFPQLAEQKYTSLVGNIDVDAEPFVLYGVVLNHYLIELVHSDDGEAKKGAAAFLEEMAASSDTHVTFLLTSEILPTLVRDQATINAYWPSLGHATRRQLTLLPPRFLTEIEFPTSR